MCTKLTVRREVWAIATSLIVGAAVLSLWGTHAYAQQPKSDLGASGAQTPNDSRAPSKTSKDARADVGQIRIMVGGLEYASNTYGLLARDLATVIDTSKTLRIMPVMGYGAVRNIVDLLKLPDIDAAIVHSDLLAYLRLTGAKGLAIDRLRYITKLYDEVFHVIARRDTKSFRDLAGLTVITGPKASGADTSGRTLLNALGLDVKIKNAPWPDAVRKLKDGSVQAIIYPTRAPSKFIQDLSRDSALHLLNVPITEQALKTYTPTRLTSKDYPGFVRSGEVRNTLKMVALLAVLAHQPFEPRSQNIAKFAQTFFVRFNDLRQPGRHAAWRALDPTENVRGWQRFGPAGQFSKQYRLAKVYTGALKTSPASTPLAAVRGTFHRALAEAAIKQNLKLSQTAIRRKFLQLLRWPATRHKVKVPIRLTSHNGIGANVGTITFSNIEIDVGRRKVAALFIKPDLHDLAPGTYAFHIHQHPDCRSGTSKEGKSVPGLAAGSHLWLSPKGVANTTGAKLYLGDLPDLIVAADKTATAQLLAPHLTLADLVDRAVVIHSSQSDSSRRMACGAIN